MSAPRPPAITLDLAPLPGESHVDHLLRVGDLCRAPRKIDLPTPAAKSAPAEELTEQQIAKMREESLERLRPPSKKRRNTK